MRIASISGSLALQLLSMPTPIDYLSSMPPIALRALVGSLALVSCVLTACLAQVAVERVSSEILVLKQKDTKPLEGASVEVVNTLDGKTVVVDRTNDQGLATCKGLDRDVKYFFKVRRSGFRPTYQESVPKPRLTIELVERYAP